MPQNIGHKAREEELEDHERVEPDADATRARAGNDRVGQEEREGDTKTVRKSLKTLKTKNLKSLRSLKSWKTMNT